MKTRSWWVLCAAAVLAAGCGGSGALESRPGRNGNVVVLDERHFTNRAGSLLRVLQLSGSPMLVRETAGCPEITFRGSKRFHGHSTPSIYVNGMRAVNTCVLDEFSAADVRRVEIYPSGVAARASYENSADGLILVFLLGTYMEH